MHREKELLNSVMPMITAEAVKMARKYANLPSMTVQDVKQEMSLEAVKALRNYDPAKASPATHAYNAIRTAKKTIRHQLKDFTGETRETIHGTAPKACPECGAKLHYGNCECGYSAAPNAVQISFECQFPEASPDLGCTGLDAEYRLFSAAEEWHPDDRQLLHALYTGDANPQNATCRPFGESVQNYYGWSRSRAQTALNRLRANCAEVLGC